ERVVALECHSICKLIFTPRPSRCAYQENNNALVVINNGSNNNGSGSPVAPTNFSEEKLTRIAVATQTVVI
ncbi:hypothetical protein ACQH80_24545, partial [Escherichia coli]|uniref:hypothetical protein n=1 Tax=Escherichia coli TaxID=562 RepID=UPI003CEAE5C6